MKKKVVHWLHEKFSTSFDIQPIEVWLFGSLAADRSNAHDCDLLIIINEENIAQLIQINEILCDEFRSEFKIPLHLTQLTIPEIEDCTDFLKQIFSKPYVRVFSSSIDPILIIENL